jgi:RNA polymerase sigma-70 factor (ECF subfamily)
MYFPTTQWTRLAEATVNGETAGRQALEDLCRRYWSPLHQFIRSRGYSEAEAEDLTQEFLLHLLNHSTLKRADPMRGRFRSFLLGALVRFLGDQRDRRQARKRGGGAPHLSLDEVEPFLAAPEASDSRFDREWGLVILEHTLASLRQEFEQGGQAARFAVLRRFLPGSLEPLSYESAAEQLGLTLPALKSDLHRFRQRFKTLVRQEVSGTVSAPHEIDEEMNHLQRVLMDKASDLGADSKPPPAVS